MRNIIKALVLIPVALVVLAFAIANRREISVSLDPFGNGDTSALTVTAPLFVFLIAALLLGVLLGGAASWLGQSKHRKAARQGRSEIERLRAEAVSLKARVADVVGGVPSLPAPAPPPHSP